MPPELLNSIEYTVTDPELVYELPVITTDPPRCGVVENFNIANKYKGQVSYNSV